MDLLLFAHIFPRPFGAGEDTTQLAKYLRVLYDKLYHKVYLFWFSFVNVLALEEVPKKKGQVSIHLL